MRTSQFQVWTNVMLESYLGDLIDAEASGRNLLFEKYAWMMEHSLPDAFAQVRHALPVLPPEQLAEVEECVAMEAVWAEECARRYPALARHGRPLRTVQDTPEQTSMETYNRGELRTYSRRTLTLYRDFLYTCRARDKNLAMEVRTHQLHAQGFASLKPQKQHCPDTIPTHKSACAPQKFLQRTGAVSSPSGLLFLLHRSGRGTAHLKSDVCMALSRCIILFITSISLNVHCLGSIERIQLALKAPHNVVHGVLNLFLGHVQIFPPRCPQLRTRHKNPAASASWADNIPGTYAPGTPFPVFFNGPKIWAVTSSSRSI